MTQLNIYMLTRTAEYTAAIHKAYRHGWQFIIDPDDPERWPWTQLNPGDGWASQMIVLAMNEEQARVVAVMADQTPDAQHWQKPHLFECKVIGVANESFDRAQMLMANW